MAVDAIVGRDVELGRISEFLGGVDDGGGALVLSGAPGMGKTVLWEHGVEEAASRGLRVLAHHAVAAEAGLAFAGLADLLTPVLDDVLPALAPPRRRALTVALRLEDAHGAGLDSTAIGLALMDALRTLAESEDVVVAIDDIQWLDSSTAGVLAPALRRLDGAPVGTLATLRVAPEVRAPFELARTFGSLGEVSLKPLAIRDLHRLLSDRLGLELSRPELTRVLEASGGNPFFALEIGREPLRRAPIPALRSARAIQLAQRTRPRAQLRSVRVCVPPRLPSSAATSRLRIARGAPKSFRPIERATSSTRALRSADGLPTRARLDEQRCKKPRHTLSLRRSPSRSTVVLAACPMCVMLRDLRAPSAS